MATGFIAPGIKVIEVDRSEVVAPVGTSIGAIVGKTNLGPPNSRIFITNDRQFFSTFGSPKSETDWTLYGAIEFLKESSQLWFTRVTYGDERYAHKWIGSETGGFASSADVVSAYSTTDVLTTLGAVYDDGYTITSENGAPGNGDLELATNTFTSAFDATNLIGCIGPGVYGNNVGISVITTASSALDGVQTGS